MTRHEAQKITANQAQEAMQRAALQVIRDAVFHNTELAIKINGCTQTIRPEQHPLYAQAMRKDTLSSSS